MQAIKVEYEKNMQLRTVDVEALKEWAEKQPHLPQLSELQQILFLQSCNFSIELAKNTIDAFFTVKRICPEFFANRDPNTAKFQEDIKVGLYAFLSKQTHEGYKIVMCKVMDSDASKYSFNNQVRIFDMSVMLSLHQEGTAEGLIILMDMDGINFAHMTKLSPMGFKKFFYYLQEAMPVRLKGLHFINVVPFMDKLLALMKPFMKKELLDMLYLHTDSIEGLFKFVPKECLPNNYGGQEDSLQQLHENFKKKLSDNADFFKRDEQQMGDESKRPGKPKNAGDIFGVEGSFKKLDID